MSTTVDNRVVEMQFDNKEFERNVQTTVSSLDKLKSSLKLSNSAKGLESIGTAAKNISLSGLSGAVETVHSKFSALEVMAVTALANITNSAVNAGKRIVSSLTIEPIKTGFQEYETQINAIQTILANTKSKGSTLEDVNNALGELNTYADKTIYNFTEMTRNIGTFTAAGVDLDTSVAAIKGIANLAAVSGSTSQQASTAMYQLSQALASGTVKLMDWNSVVNAGMGGQVFQDALKETARAHGIAVDDIIESEGSFRDSLKDGWLTSDVLTETLSKFTGDLSEEQLKSMGYTEDQIKSIVDMGKTANDAATKVKTFTQLFDTLKESAQSGWTQTWEIIVGDFEEAKELLTDVSNTFGNLIGAAAESRNAMLQGWKDLGGRTALIEGVRNALQGIASVITPIKEAFREIFPPMTAEQLYKITESFKNLTAKLKLSDEQSANLKSTFKGLFAVVDICKEAFVAVFNAVKPLIGGVGNLGSKILGVTGSWGEWLVKLRDTIKETDVFGKAIGTMVDVAKKTLGFLTTAFGAVIEKAKTLFGFFKEKFVAPGLEVIHALLERFHIRLGNVAESATEFKDGVCGAFNGIVTSAAWKTFSAGMEGFLGIFEALWTAVKKIAGAIGDFAKSMGSGLAETVGDADFEKIFDVVNGGLLAAILLGIKKFVSGFRSSFDELGGIIDNVKGILDSVRGCFEAYQKSLQAKTLLTIAGAIAILAASIVVLSLIDSKKLTASLGAITVLFADLLGSMAIFSKLSGLKGVTKTVTAMLGISVSVLILAGALKKVADIDTSSLVTGLAGIVALTTTVVTAAKSLSSNAGTVIKGAVGLIAFALTIKILASVCEDLSTLSWEEMAKGLVGVGVLLAEVALFLNTAKFSSKTTSTATGMIAMAAAIKILASACEDFGQMNWGEIVKGLVAVGVLLGEIALFTKLTGDAKKVTSTATAMVLLGSAMLIFAEAINNMGSMSWEELAKGLLGMAGALTAVIVALNLMPKNVLGKGAGLVTVATALVILAEALDKTGNMSWEEIAKGLVALGGSLLVLAGGLNLMNGTLSGSAALLVASASLLMLAPALSLMGAMSWESIAKGLITLAGAFAVIGVAGLVLSPIVPAILGLGGAFALIGAGVLGLGAGLAAIGLGLSAIATGFLALSTIGTAGATAVVAALTIIIAGIAGLIPEVIKKIGEGLIMLCQVIIDGAPLLCQAVVEIVKAVVVALVEAVPLIVDGIVIILAKAIETLAEYTPGILKNIADILMAILKTIVEYTPDVIKAGLDILIGFLKALAEKLPDVISAAVDVVVAFLDGISKKLPDVIQAGFNLLISFLDGITNAINNNTPVLVEKMKGLFLALLGAALEVLKGGVELVWEAGKKIMDSGLIQGIWDKVKAFTKKVGEVISEGVKTIKDKFKEWIQAGKDLIVNIIDGIKDKFTSFTNKVKELISDGLQKIKDKFTEWKTAGKDLIDKVISGIKDKFTTAKTAVGDLITNAKDAIIEKLEDWKTAGKDLIDGFVGGIKDKATSVVDTAKGVVSDALEGAKKLLGIKSPSREFKKVGIYSDEGIIEGLNAYSGKVTGAAKEVGGNMLDAMTNTVSGISDIINDDDWQPTIRPVLDTSNVESGMRGIDAMFSKTQAMRLNSQMNDSEFKMGYGDGPAMGATYQFTQNNYSPKALSRRDIYRQTKNQFSTLKGLVKA